MIYTRLHITNKGYVKNWMGYVSSYATTIYSISELAEND